MSISATDMSELKRISTNTYDGDKACMNRIIRGIGMLNNEIRMLKLENEKLAAEIKEIKVTA
jgi:hypothetical protein